MKHISFILIALWSCWILFTHGDMKASENPVLWILGAMSFMYVTVNAVIYLVEWRRK